MVATVRSKWKSFLPQGMLKPSGTLKHCRSFVCVIFGYTIYGEEATKEEAASLVDEARGRFVKVLCPGLDH